MKSILSCPLAHVSQRSWRAVLVVVLLGAILAFGLFSFAPSAHAASASPSAASVTVKIVTKKALSVRVAEVSGSLNHCYNTPSHTVTIIGLKGTVRITGYASANCAGSALCTLIEALPSSGIGIITLSIC